MQVRKPVIVRVNGKEASFDTLFDPSSTITLTSYETLKKLLGKVPIKKLARKRWIILANGEKIGVEAYVDAEIIFDKYMIEDRIYLSREFARKAIIKGREVKLPDLIIGAPTIES